MANKRRSLIKPYRPWLVCSPDLFRDFHKSLWRSDQRRLWPRAGSPRRPVAGRRPSPRDSVTGRDPRVRSMGAH